mgnify:CR=1 FL=1
MEDLKLAILIDADNISPKYVKVILDEAATFGVAVYSDIDIISSMCMLMARGAVVSMLCVIFILPALLMLCPPRSRPHAA